jgi:hypothetical protein
MTVVATVARQACESIRRIDLLLAVAFDSLARLPIRSLLQPPERGRNHG